VYRQCRGAITATTRGLSVIGLDKQTFNTVIRVDVNRQRPEIVLLTYLLTDYEREPYLQGLANNSALLPNVPVSQDMVFPYINVHSYQGRMQEGADGAKAPPPPNSLDKHYLLIQIRSILCFAVCTKKSVSQSY